MTGFMVPPDATRVTLAIETLFRWIEGRVVAMVTESQPEVREWPLARWQEIAAAFRPTEAPTEARLATLRRNNALSRGLRAHRRDGHQVAGRVALYCRLNVDAAALYRRGRDEDARRYAAAAHDWEETWEKRLAELRVSLSELADAAGGHIGAGLQEVLLQLNSSLTEIARGLPPVRNEETVSGHLREREGEWVRFSGIAASGKAHVFDLPVTMVREAGLAVGDACVVRREILPTGAAVLSLARGLSVKPAHDPSTGGPGPGAGPAMPPHEEEPGDAPSEPMRRGQRPVGDEAARDAFFDELDNHAAVRPLGRRVAG